MNPSLPKASLWLPICESRKACISQDTNLVFVNRSRFIALYTNPGCLQFFVYLFVDKNWAYSPYDKCAQIFFKTSGVLWEDAYAALCQVLFHASWILRTDKDLQTVGLSLVVSTSVIIPASPTVEPRRPVWISLSRECWPSPIKRDNFFIDVCSCLLFFAPGSKLTSLLSCRLISHLNSPRIRLATALYRSFMYPIDFSLAVNAFEGTWFSH